MASQMEDPSAVLEQFIQDVANLPAEIAHLLEEVQAKDEQMSRLRTAIHGPDMVLQKHVKSKGALAKHEKEDALIDLVSRNFHEAQALQEEKVALTNKAAFLLDRHVKRLDFKIRDLQNEGAIGADPTLPSLLHDSHANRVRLAPTPGSVARLGGTPLTTLASSTGSSTNVANAAVAQMLNRAGAQTATPTGAPAAAMQPNPALNGSSNGLAQRRRDLSANGGRDAKRQRLNASLGPLPSAIQRHSSAGPGTPKAATPTTSRAGSAGPRSKKTTKKIPPHVQSMRRKHGRVGLSKSSARRLQSTKKGTPSSTGDDDSNDDDGSGSDDDGASGMAPQGNAGDEDDMDVVVQDDDADDSKLYCTCQRVSHGDMVACDNEDCPYEWFHWPCVGLTQEPKGRWLCDHCRKLPQSRIKLAR